MIINKKRVLYFHISNIIRIFVIINEQVKDILQAFKRLTSEKASIQEAMDAMHTENDNLRRNVENCWRRTVPCANDWRNTREQGRTQKTSSTPPSNERMKDEALLYAKSLLRKKRKRFLYRVLR